MEGLRFKRFKNDALSEDLSEDVVKINVTSFMHSGLYVVSKAISEDVTPQSNKLSDKYSIISK